MKHLFQSFRRTLVLLTLCLASLQLASAQIKKDFFCGIIGESTKAKVLDNLKGKRIEFLEVTDEMLVCKDEINFEGAKWSVALNFYNGLLLRVIFARRIDSLDDMAPLAAAFDQKYSRYKKTGGLSPNYYHDNINDACIFTLDNADGGYTLTLSYTNLPLQALKVNAEDKDY